MINSSNLISSENLDLSAWSHQQQVQVKWGQYSIQGAYCCANLIQTWLFFPHLSHQWTVLCPREPPTCAHCLQVSRWNYNIDWVSLLPSNRWWNILWLIVCELYTLKTQITRCETEFKVTQITPIEAMQHKTLQKQCVNFVGFVCEFITPSFHWRRRPLKMRQTTQWWW